MKLCPTKNVSDGMLHDESQSLLHVILAQIGVWIKWIRVSSSAYNFIPLLVFFICCQFVSLSQISLGTITSIEEAVQWLNYTYLYVRVMKNPLAYGVNYYQKEVSAVIVE